MSSKKKTKEYEDLSINISGYEFEQMFQQYIKDKIGPIDIDYIEVCLIDENNHQLLNWDVNAFRVYVNFWK